MKQTPLAGRHRALGARMAPFAGWEMPIHYEGILAEHRHTRGGASVFDVGHMGEFEFRGPRAAGFLERLLTQRVGSLEPGQSRYGYLLNERGGVLDDVICFRQAADRFWIVVNAGPREKDAAWVRDRLEPGVEFVDLSDRTAKLDVQGPGSRPAVEAALGGALPDLGFFRFAELRFGSLPVLVSRTGYTGEFGYELFFPRERAGELWDRLLAVPGVRPAGLGARDTLRLEMGYPLYGHELDENRTPAGIARPPFLDLEKEFIGRDAVREDLARGPERLVGLRLEGRRAARPGHGVFDGRGRAGTVTSGSFAPSLGAAVALAFAAPGRAEEGGALAVEGDGFRAAATVVRLPFYASGTARRK